MDFKRSTWILLALASTSWAEPHLPSKVPPPLWSGSSGWQFDPAGMHVAEGIRQPGDIIIEENVRLSRTGIIKEVIRMKNGRGADLVIPEGAKAFAISLRPSAEGYQGNSQVDWCVLLPPEVNGTGREADSVCISWENEQQARYRQDLESGGLAFLPVDRVPGVVPKIEEQPVDLGLQLTPWRRALATAHDISRWGGESSTACRLKYLSMNPAAEKWRSGRLPMAKL